jgi:energy-coupling factor transport system permease protein
MFDFNSLLFGQYRPSNTLIHRLDPRTKILWTVAVVSIVAFSLDMPLYAGLTVYLVILISLARISASRLLPVFKASLLMFAITLLLHLLFSEPSGKLLFKIGSVEFTIGAFENGLKYSYRIFLLLMTMAVVNFTTSPIDLADGLLRLLAPLRLIRVPVSEIGMMVFVALRFVPVLADETRSIRAAQLSRGLKLAGGPIGRIRETMPLILQLFAGAVRRADYLAIAIESRGYQRGTYRTSLKAFRLRRGDYVFAGVLIILVALLVMLRTELAV